MKFVRSIPVQVDPPPNLLSEVRCSQHPVPWKRNAGANKILRTETAQVLANTEDLRLIADFTRLTNERIATLVDTVKRWHAGEFGVVAGEDQRLATQMQTFTDVALQGIDAKFLVRVFAHLERGTLLQSARGLMVGQSRRNPADGPLERAKIREDTKQVARLEDYLKIVERCADQSCEFLPLVFVKGWRKELGEKWVNLIIDEAAQHLKGHVGKVAKWEKDEAARLAELEKFKTSPLGQAYLKARAEHFPEGLPRNLAKRFSLFSNPKLVLWHKQGVLFTPAKNFQTLVEQNPELSALVKADMTFWFLSKASRPPKWTPVNAQHKRWPFIPIDLAVEAQMSQSTGNPRSKANNQILLKFNLPTAAAPAPSNAAEIPITRTLTVALSLSGRFVQAKASTGKGTFSLADEITGITAKWSLKGLRFVPNGAGWRAKLSLEKESQGPNPRITAFCEALKSGSAPHLVLGDMVAVMVLNPQAKRQDGANWRRAGWIEVYGVTENGARVLDSRAIDHKMLDQVSRPQAIRRGQKTWWGAAAGKHRGLSTTPSVHGHTRGITLAAISEKITAWERERRLLKILKDPERADEAKQWLQHRISFYQNRSKHTSADRLKRLVLTLDSGQPLNALQLRPFERRIRAMRYNLQNLKRDFRHDIAKQVIRHVNRVRTGHANAAVRSFVAEHSGHGAVTALLVEKPKSDAGPGHFKARAQNRALSAFGAAIIGQLVSEKAMFVTPSIGVLEVSPKDIRRECPSCQHPNPKAPSGPDFVCSDKRCGTTMPAERAFTFNLARRFFDPSSNSAEGST